MKYAVCNKTLFGEITGKELFTKGARYKVLVTFTNGGLVLINNKGTRHTVTSAPQGWRKYFSEEVTSDYIIL